VSSPLCCAARLITALYHARALISTHGLSHNRSRSGLTRVTTLLHYRRSTVSSPLCCAAPLITAPYHARTLISTHGLSHNRSRPGRALISTHGLSHNRSKPGLTRGVMIHTLWDPSCATISIQKTSCHSCLSWRILGRDLSAALNGSKGTKKP
jgi:hypothetical protein